MSVNIQTSDGLVKIAGTPTIDTSFSNISKNPVQNNVITQKFEQIDSQIRTQNSNLTQLEYSDVAGGKNLFQAKELNVNGNNIPQIIHDNFEENTQYTFSFTTKSRTSIDMGSFYFNYTDGTYINMGWDTTVGASNSKTSDKGKTIKTIEWKGWNYGEYASFSDIQIEEGTPTPYEPYIPSVKMLADEVNAQNDSLSDYGLVNDFDGTLKQGYYNSSGALVSSAKCVCTENKPISVGKTVKVKYGKSAYWICVRFYDASGTLLDSSYTQSSIGVTELLSKEAPTNTASYNVSFEHTVETTPTTAGSIRLYIDNAIENLKNDLDIYKPKQYYGKSVTIEQSGMYLVTATAMGYGVMACTYIVYKNSSEIYHIEKVSGINLTLSTSGNVITPSYTENGIYFYVQRIANFWS